jgi:hypothetical protein
MTEHEKDILAYLILGIATLILVPLPFKGVFDEDNALELVCKFWGLLAVVGIPMATFIWGLVRVIRELGFIH